jgi:hypothetical protein
MKKLGSRISPNSLGVTILIILVMLNLNIMVNSSNNEDYLSKSPLNNLQKPLQYLLREFKTTGDYHFPITNNKNLLYSNHKSTKIPKIIHFIFSLEVFGIVQFLSVASAYVIHKGYLIYVHCPNVPTGFYWDMVSSCVSLIRKIECILCIIYTNFAVVILYIS